MASTSFQDLLNEGKIDLGLINYPVVCPHCGSKTEIQDSMPRCPNYECSGRIYGRVQKYVEALDIKGVGEEAVRQMVENGYVNHPKDLYKVDLTTYCRLERKGEKHYAKMQAGLQARKVMDLWELLGAMSIEEAAAETWLHVAKAGFDTLDKILAASPKELERAQRVTERKASDMLKQLRFQEPQIREMLDRGYVQLRTVRTGTAIAGKTVVMTGTHSKPRKWYETEVKNAGGYFSNNLTKQTHYLVIPDANWKSSKMADAKRYGTQVITEGQLLEMLK